MKLNINVREISLNIIEEGILKLSDLTPYSDYYGVKWSWDSRMWKAYIKYEGIKHPLGYFIYEHEAALAYNKAALDMYKDYTSSFKLLNEVVDIDSKIQDIKFKNIRYESKTEGYVPHISINYKPYSLGNYKSKLTAILVWNNAVRKLFGYKSRKVHKLNGREI